MFIIKLISVPKEVHDESAALNQFKTEFNRRFFQEGPDFTTKVFGEAVKEAFRCPAKDRKALGKFSLILM